MLLKEETVPGLDEMVPASKCVRQVEMKTVPSSKLGIERCKSRL